MSKEVETSLQSYAEFAKYVMASLCRPLPAEAAEGDAMATERTEMEALLCVEKVMGHGLERPSKNQWGSVIVVRIIIVIIVAIVTVIVIIFVIVVILFPLLV